IHVWSLLGLKRVRLLETGAAEIRCAAFSRDGRHLAVGGADHRIHLWDLERGQPLVATSNPPQASTSIALSPDGKRLVSNGGGGSCRIWDTATRHLVRTLSD